MGGSSKGKNLCMTIAGYMILKSIVNLVIGFGTENIIMLVIAAALGYGLTIAFKYLNFVTAGFLAAMVLIHIKDNIANIGFNVYLLYIAEAVIDVICVYLLVADRSIKEHFGQD